MLEFIECLTDYRVIDTLNNAILICGKNDKTRMFRIRKRTVPSGTLDVAIIRKIYGSTIHSNDIEIINDGRYRCELCNKYKDTIARISNLFLCQKCQPILETGKVKFLKEMPEIFGSVSFQHKYEDVMEDIGTIQLALYDENKLYIYLQKKH